MPSGIEFREKMRERMKGNTRGFKTGDKPWNKGQKQWEGKKHPMLGKKHSKNSLIKMSKKIKEAWAEGKFENRKINYEEIGKKISKSRKKLFKDKKLKVWSYIDGRSKNASPARYGDDWFKIRLLIYKRDNFTCQKCGERMSKFPFHVHHIVPFLISFDNSLNNLITLCPPCHGKEDARIIKKIKQGEIIH